MLNALIIEEESPAAGTLISSLASVARDVNIVERLSTVRDSIHYLSQKPAVDLIFSDVQLSDGLSFEIFNQNTVRTPVIFVAGYDEHIVNAFDYNGIDYLIKPFDQHRLRKALAKYRMLKSHFNYDDTGNKLLQYSNRPKKKRMLVKRAAEYMPLLLEDIVVLYSEGRHVYVFDRYGVKYIGDKTLGELEIELDEEQFFRVSMQYIVNLNFIRAYRSFEKTRIQIELSVPLPDHNIIISQEMAPHFRAWMQKL